MAKLDLIVQESGESLGLEVFRGAFNVFFLFKRDTNRRVVKVKRARWFNYLILNLLNLLFEGWIKLVQLLLFRKNIGKNLIELLNLALETLR